MKQGQSFPEVRAEVKRQLALKRDFIAPATAAALVCVKGQVKFSLAGQKGGHVFGVRPTAHKQLAGYTKIPQQYYERMLLDEPELLAANVNRWLSRKDSRSDRRMVRTLGNEVRALVSPRFRRLDNADLMEMMMEELDAGANDHLVVESSALTDEHLYIKIRKPSLRHVVLGNHVVDTTGMKVHDIVEAAVVVSNSEVGYSSFRVEPMVFRVACLNGMLASYALKKYHIGRELQLKDEDVAMEVMSDEARRAEDKAFWLKARDVFRAALNEEIFKAECERIDAAAREALPVGKGGLEKTVDNLVVALGLPEVLGGQVLTNLVAAGDLTRWGAANAITRTANDAEDYETATMLERSGGQVLELAPTEWRRLAA